MSLSSRTYVSITPASNFDKSTFPSSRLCFFRSFFHRHPMPRDTTPPKKQIQKSPKHPSQNKIKKQLSSHILFLGMSPTPSHAPFSSPFNSTILKSTACHQKKTHTNIPLKTANINLFPLHILFLASL